MAVRVVIPENPSEADRNAVIEPLRAYNASQVENPLRRPVAILLVDEDGTHVGGLWGKFTYDWLHIEFLALHKDHRGRNYGTIILHEAERLARSNNCVGIWLDTFEFQACGFYKKFGFEIFGKIEDHPIGQNRFFLRKRF